MAGVSPAQQLEADTFTIDLGIFCEPGIGHNPTTMLHPLGVGPRVPSFLKIESCGLHLGRSPDVPPVILPIVKFALCYNSLLIFMCITINFVRDTVSLYENAGRSFIPHS